MKSLYLEGVRVIFGLPGVQLYHAMDALYQEPGIRFITTRHEQATAYMADGYSRAGGGIGTALMVPGPGLQNASAGIGTAYAASSPILVVAGQIERDLIGANRGILHEVDDQLDLIKSFGFVSGRDQDKLKDVPFRLGEAGNPLLQECWGYLDCRVVNAMDGGDMTCFLADVVDGDILVEGPPLWWREARRRLPAQWMEEWDRKIAGEIELSKLRMNQINLTPDFAPWKKDGLERRD